MPSQEKNLKFFGGRGMSFLPLIVMVIFMLYAAVSHSDLGLYWVAGLLGLIVGLFLTRTPEEYAKSAVRGLTNNIFAVMVIAVALAGVVGTIIKESGMITTLAVYVAQIGLTGPLFVVVAFLLTCFVAFSTGTSMGTIFIVGPILYPIGYLAGCSPVVLLAALIAGGAFGDNLAPISDTTIASATTQKMDIGGVVASRVKYAIPAAAIAAILYLLVGHGYPVIGGGEEFLAEANPISLLMILVPVVIIVLCLLRKHLLVALSCGIVTGLIIGLVTGIYTLGDILSVPVEWTSGGLLYSGVSGALDAITILIFLFPIIQIMYDGGGVDLILHGLSKHVRGPRSAEASIGATVLGLNAATGLNTAAIVAAGPIAAEIGGRYRIHGYRRANLLDCFGNTLNYLIPWNAVVIVGSLMSIIAAPIEGAMVVSPIDLIPYVFYSWALLAIMIFAIITGYGRVFAADDRASR